MGHLHLYVADRWPTGTSPDYNCEAANPAYRKRDSWVPTSGTPMGDWFKMGSYLSPSLISIR